MTVGARLHAVALRRAWLIAVLLVVVAVLALVDLGKYYEWDEAVFASQSRDHLGSGAPARDLAASREVGPVALVAVLGVVDESLPTTRLLWSLVSVGLLALAFRALQPTVGRRAALTGFLAAGTFWSALLYVGSLYGSLLGAAACLLATGLYLQVLEPDRSDGWWTRLGVGLGLALALGFWFRQVESLLVLAVLGAHAGLRLRTTRHRLRLLATSAVTFVLAFVVPWLVDSTVRYGSPQARVEAARAQPYPRGLTSNVGDYVRLLGGDSYYRSFDPVPTWPRAVFLAVLATSAVLLVVVAVRRWRTAARVVLLGVIAAVSFGFFFFYGGIVEDRYVLYGVVFTAAAVGATVDAGVRVMAPRARLRVLAPAALVVAAVWIAANAALLVPHERTRVLVGQDSALTAATVRTLAAGRPCTLLARFGAPQLQIGSGCTTMVQTDPVQAQREARAAVRERRFAAVLWPADSAPLAGAPRWATISRTLAGGGEQVLRYRVAEGTR